MTENDAQMLQGAEGEGMSEWSWSIVERAGQDRQKLRQLLWELSKEDICRFNREFRWTMTELMYEPFNILISESTGESEDGISDIAEWVVGRGRAAYEEILANPEAIPRHVHVADPGLLLIVVLKVFHEKFGTDLTREPSAWPETYAPTSSS